MTLKEAVDSAEAMLWEHDATLTERHKDALRVLIDATRERLDDTAEIVLPSPTCRGKGQITHSWADGTAAVSPCPTCRPKPTPVTPAAAQ